MLCLWVIIPTKVCYLEVILKEVVTKPPNAYFLPMYYSIDMQAKACSWMRADDGEDKFIKCESALLCRACAFILAPSVHQHVTVFVMACAVYLHFLCFLFLARRILFLCCRTTQITLILTHHCVVVMIHISNCLVYYRILAVKAQSGAWLKPGL